MLLGQLSENGKKLFLSLATVLANIDGECSVSEQRLLKQYCEEMSIDPIPYDANTNIQDIVRYINESMTVKEKKIIFIELIAVAVIDGVYDDKEKEFVESLRKLLKIPEDVGRQAFDMIKLLVDASTSIENFVEW